MIENHKLIDALVAATRCAETLAQVIRSMAGGQERVTPFFKRDQPYALEPEPDLDDDPHDYQFNYDDPAAHKRMLDEYERLGRERRAKKEQVVLPPEPPAVPGNYPTGGGFEKDAEDLQDDGEPAAEDEDTSGTDDAGKETDIGGGERPPRPGTMMEQIVKVLKARSPHWMTPPGIRTVLNEGKKPKDMIGENETGRLLLRQRSEQTFSVPGLQVRPHGARFEYRIAR